jgi:hypothetical protein
MVMISSVHAKYPIADNSEIKEEEAWGEEGDVRDGLGVDGGHCLILGLMTVKSCLVEVAGQERNGGRLLLATVLLPCIRGSESTL